MKEKLDSLVKKLTDDVKLIKNIRSYARQKMATEKWANRMLYVEPSDFYQFIIKTHPDLIPKIPENYQPTNAAECSFAIGSISMYGSALSYDELFKQNIALENANAKLKQELEEANKQLATYRKLGAPKGKRAE